MANIADYFVMGEAACVVIGGLFGGLRFLRRNSAKEQREAQRDLDLAYVKGQVSPDSGKSMFDRVARTENKVDVLTARFEDHLRVGGD